MAWQQRSRRRSELPSNWTTIRAAVLHRDGNTCRIRGPRCTVIASECDHVGDRHDHRYSNLRAACHNCHGTRTAQQSHAARPVLKRPAPRHPGLL